MPDAVKFTDKGIYVPDARVYIDPWKPVQKAIITHGHSDHSRVGMKQYIAHSETVPIIKYRLGGHIQAEGREYNHPFTINGVRFTLFPAGHIRGSAQVRIEGKGQTWVVSGDYKTEGDDTCTGFEPVKCSHFITESTFGLPVYNWPDADVTFDLMAEWVSDNQQKELNSLILGYSLGKAQRIISGLSKRIDSEIRTHGAIENLNRIFRDADPSFPVTRKLEPGEKITKGVIVAPPSVIGSPWLRRLQPCATAMGSGWMALRGARRRRNVDKGFVLSDHADWDGLNAAVAATGAENVYATHGYSEIFSNWLISKGLNGKVVSTEFEGEINELNPSGEDVDSEV